MTLAATKEILEFKKSIDVYCPECKQLATFHPEIDERTNTLSAKEVQATFRIKAAGLSSNPLSGWNLKDFSKRIRCTRSDHEMDFHFKKVQGSLIKVGQHPSISDIASMGTEEFVKPLGKSAVAELNKAMGLAAHGIGIGSYVYLRRIFESLVEEAHKKAAVQNDWVEVDYINARMQERVRLVKDFLPDFVVEHPEMYSILSRGLHELSEDECLSHFEALKTAIFNSMCLVVTDATSFFLHRKCSIFNCT